MVLSVVNLQEAYAKALLVDRAALRAAQAGRRRARRPRGAARRLSAPTSARLCAAGARRARRRRGPGRARCASPATPPAWPPSVERRASGADPMSTVALDHRPRRRPLARGGARRTTRSTSSCWPRTCSAPTAPCRTSAAATRRPRAPRSTTPAARSTRCGSRARAATSRRWAPSTSPALRLDEVLPLIERDEMSDEEMVAYLARCQLDPAMPRCVDRDAAARLRAGAARAPHAPRRHQRARRHGRRRAAGGRVLRRRGRLDPLHPAGLHAVQAGRARPCATTRGLKLVVLAKHGLVVWGDSARGGLPPHDRGHQPGRRLRQRAHRRARRASAAAPRTPGRRRAAALAAASCCRRSAARCPASAPRSSPSTPRARVLEFVSLARRPQELVDRRRAVPRPPRAHQARCRCGSRSTPRPTTPRR